MVRPSNPCRLRDPFTGPLGLPVERRGSGGFPEPFTFEADTVPGGEGVCAFLRLSYTHCVEGQLSLIPLGKAVTAPGTEDCLGTNGVVPVQRGPVLVPSGAPSAVSWWTLQLSLRVSVSGRGWGDTYLL